MSRPTLLLPMCLTFLVPAFAASRSSEGGLQPLRFGEIRPRGWLLSQMEENLGKFTGHLDRLAPDLILEDDIYGRDRLTPKVRSKDLGAQGIPLEDQAQLLWWNSETQSNWKDGFLRTAILLDHEEGLEKARSWVESLLATQDEDGYLGIYAPELRYRTGHENGELWAKATAFRYLIAWYEHSQDPAVLRALIRAVDEVMRSFPIGTSQPFHSPKPDAPGVTHGLAFIDVLVALHRLVGDQRYADYAVFLYRHFSSQPLNEDAQIPKLLDPMLPLKGHGVHTYEHLRCVAAAAHFSNDPEMVAALASFELKVAACCTATGAPIGDEFIGGTHADSTRRGYEYCSLQELAHSDAELLILTGDSSYGDAIESLFLNAAQGARHPSGEGIAYLKSDNSYEMTGPLNGDPATPHQSRYKYSPVHRDAAVCCVPNAGRIAPTYVQHMWMVQGNDLVATLFGPCEARFLLSGRLVIVVEDTRYPADGRIRFTVTGAPEAARLKVRRPAWADTITANREFGEEAGFLVFKLEAGDNSIEVNLPMEPRSAKNAQGETYFGMGPLVLARPIPGDQQVSLVHPVDGFRDLKYTSSDPALYAAPSSPEIRRLKDGSLEARLVNAGGGLEWVGLKPVGSTILRQVTFAPASGR